MAISKIQILGLRGFAENQSLSLAIPTNMLGSGLTVIVGSNNTGKSTVIEAIRAFSKKDSPSFSRGKRNLAAGDTVSISLQDENGNRTTLRSIVPGGSETVVDYQALKGGEPKFRRPFVLPSRRAFSTYFGRSSVDRDNYILHSSYDSTRSHVIDDFTARLFTVEAQREKFDSVLRKILDPVPIWTIDQEDHGQYFLKIQSGDASHSSEGMGEGLVSLLFIIDALYDSNEGDTICIDEPELSLHPELQRRLATLLLNFSKDRQIVISTHSPYFVPMEAFANGAALARVYRKDKGSCISQLSVDAAKEASKLLKDTHKPHILGLNAQEIFFIEDRVILVEGQEDVIYFDRILTDLGAQLGGTFFGWGVGGSGNMPIITRLLHELGYQRLVGILDADKDKDRLALSAAYKNYHFLCIPAKDIRTKKARRAEDLVQGLLDDDNTSVRMEHREEMKRLLREAEAYLTA